MDYKIKNKNLKILFLVSIVMLFGSILTFWPYFYYQILRILVTITSIIYAIYFYKKTNKIDYSIMLIVILFNPIAPLFFDRYIWLILDFVAGFIFIFKYKKLNRL